MTLQFEQLSDILLQEIFEFIDVKDLFKFRFLNKYLFKIVNRVIKRNLIYSIYNQNGIDDKFGDYQNNFIIQYGPQMRHININSCNIYLLSYCPNIESIRYNYLDGEDCEKYELTEGLPKLRKMVMNLNYFQKSMDYFSTYLNQLEVFGITGTNITIGNCIKYFNPNKLYSFIVIGKGNLYLDGLDHIKRYFYKLKVLKIHSESDFTTQRNELRSNISFNSNLKLEVKGRFSFSIKCFGDLKQLKSVKLFNNIYIHLDKNKRQDSIKLVEGSNILSLGYFHSNDFINCCKNLPSLKEICIYFFSIESLASIALLTNIQTLHFTYLKNRFDGIDRKFILSNDDACKVKCNLDKCQFIKEITFDSFSASFEEFCYFLSFFPNLGILKIKNFELIDTDTEVECELTSCLFLVAPVIPDMDPVLETKLETIPMFTWVKDRETSLLL
ncbi:hypothetical protein K502DRAFT_332928 [Neoconidiobolus thromboides FSU 785]|nr:hypothetical protein K502DRAFT_332928 [Neoconidiobolus thromboides FSU 785]